MRLKHFFVGCLLLLTANSAQAVGFAKVGTAFGSWGGLTASARFSALGGADLAEGTPSALLVNPAPLGNGNSAALSYDKNDFLGFADINTYAAAVEVSGFHLNFVQQELVGDDILIRMAFNPEGSGETFSIRERIQLVGLSYDLGPQFENKGPFFWSIGLNWRNYSGGFDDTKTEGNSIDIGTTMGWISVGETSWTSLKAIVSRQNVGNANYTFGDRESPIPSASRLGLTFATALRNSPQTEDKLKLLIAYSHTSPSYQGGIDHIGAEMVLYNLLAMRYGYNTRYSTGINSWGLGMLLNRDWMGSFEAELSWGTMSDNITAESDSKQLWGVRLRYAL